METCYEGIGDIYEDFEVVWNNQKVILTCECGQELELYADAPETCACGRVYWIETTVHTSAVPQDEDEDLLQMTGV